MSQFWQNEPICCVLAFGSRERKPTSRAAEVLAYKWLNLAAVRAKPGTREYYARIRDAVAAKLTPAQVAQAQWLAYHFIPMR